MSDTQISAYISEETKEQVERFIGAHGMDKGGLIEQALLHHLQALRELPSDVIIPPRVELSQDSFAEIAQLAARPRKPNKMLQALVAGKLDINNDLS